MAKLKLPSSTQAATNSRVPPQRPRVSKRVTPGDAAVKAKLKIPSERDESVDMTDDVPDPMIEQAALDVARGLQDTSKGNELDRAYKKLK